MPKADMIKEILMVAKASGAYTTGELFFTLAFSTEQELKEICRELHIKVPA